MIWRHKLELWEYERPNYTVQAFSLFWAILCNNPDQASFSVSAGIDKDVLRKTMFPPAIEMRTQSWICKYLNILLIGINKLWPAFYFSRSIHPSFGCSLQRVSNLRRSYWAGSHVLCILQARLHTWLTERVLSIPRNIYVGVCMLTY